MDYQRKKQLTQSVNYLQSAIVIGQDMTDLLKAKNIFTDEELMTIQVRHVRVCEWETHDVIREYAPRGRQEVG